MAMPAPGWLPAIARSFLASPLGVIHEYNFERTIEQVAYAAEEYQIEKIVVGYPVNMDGSAGERAQKCALFAQKHRKRFRSRSSSGMSAAPP